jgi:uncharacterized Zn-finger protein
MSATAPAPGSAQSAVAPGPATPSAQATVHITRKDLPLHCPMPAASLWSSHPRVFLPIEAGGKAKCPYCGTEYILDDA